MIAKNPAKNYFLKNFFSMLFLCFLGISLGSCGGGAEGGGGEVLYSVSGTVTSGSSGLVGVTITLMGTSSATTTTDSNGVYQVSNLAAGSYTVTPSKAGYTFNPLSTTVSITNSNVTGQNFAATALTWAKTYGGSSSDIARSIQQTSDSGFIVAGETSSFGTNTDVWILKLESNGNIGWQKTYGGSGVDMAHSIQQTLDGGFIVAGETSSSGAGYADFWILKIDENGNI